MQSGGDLHRRLSDLAAASAQQSVRKSGSLSARRAVDTPVDVFTDTARASVAYAHAPRSRAAAAPPAAFPAPYSGRTLGGG